MELFIAPDGAIRAIYAEAIALQPLGSFAIERASLVEPSETGEWFAQIIDGPVLGPFIKRSEALAAEVEWLTLNRLSATPAISSKSNSGVQVQ